jgi:D-mannonate dehydratase
MVRKITDVKLYDTLCNNNNWVQYKLRCIRKTIKDPEMKELVNECLDILRYMKTQGQHMENRMREYLKGIERLGFQRDRKHT